MAGPMTERRPVALPVAPTAGRRPSPRGRRDRRRGRRLVPRPVARRRPGRLRHRPVGHPAAGGGRRSTAGRRRCCPGPPRRSSPSPGPRTAPGWPTWSAPAAPSAPSCTSSGPTAPTTGWSPARTRARPSSPVAGPARAPTSARSRPATGRTPTSCWSTPPPARTARSPPAASCRSPRCRPTSGSCWPAAARAGYRHIVVVDVATGTQRRVLAPGRPRRRRLGGRPVRAGRPLGATCAPRCPGRRSPTGPGWSRSRCRADGVPGEGRVVLCRPDADLDGYALRTDGTVLAVWNAGGVTELLVHAVADGSVVRRIALPEPVMPGWSLSADGDTMVAELTGPRRPRGAVGRPDQRRRRPAPLPRLRPRPDPALLVGAGAARLRRARRAAAVGLALHAARRARPQPHRGQLPRRTRGAGAAGLVAGRAEPGRRRVHRLRPERARVGRVRPGVHDRGRRRRARGVVRRRADDGRRAGHRRHRRARADRRARLVLRRLPDPGRADPVAGPVRRRCHAGRDERPADLLRRHRAVDGRGLGHRVRRPGRRPGAARRALADDRPATG